jgi:hypothetical protein
MKGRKNARRPFLVFMMQDVVKTGRGGGGKKMGKKIKNEGWKVGRWGIIGKQVTDGNEEAAAE